MADRLGECLQPGEPPMSRLIVRNAARIVTMDDARTEIADGDILVEGGVIRRSGCRRRARAR